MKDSRMSSSQGSQGVAFAIGLVAGSIAAWTITYLTTQLSTGSNGSDQMKQPQSQSRSQPQSHPPQQLSQPSISHGHHGHEHQHPLPPEIRAEMLSRNTLYFQPNEPVTCSKNTNGGNGGKKGKRGGNDKGKSNGNKGSNNEANEPSSETMVQSDDKKEISTNDQSSHAKEPTKPTGMVRIQSSHILIIGLGGVGSHTAHMLARSGVGYLRMVDFDQVTLSSLNRHAVATLADVGRSKADVLARRLREICPDGGRYEGSNGGGGGLILDPVVRMYTGDESKDGGMLDPPEGCDGWDVVIDAIDDVPTKAKLIATCAKRGIRVLSCMGAGGKADPTRIHISDLRSASRDPLATSVRQKLRMLWKHEEKKKEKEEGNSASDDANKDNEANEENSWINCIDDSTKVSIVYSSEKVVAKLAQITDEQKSEGLHNFGAMDNMRVRVLPVVGTMPAIMGQTLAAVAVCELGGKPFSPVGAERVGRNVRHRLFQHLKQREKKIQEKLQPSSTSEIEKKYNPNKIDTNTTKGIYIPNGTYLGPVQIDQDDVEYLLSELWRNRCAITGERLGSALELIRWDRTRPATPNNVVLMCQKATMKFDKDWEELGDGREGVSKRVRRRVEERLGQCVLDAEEICY